MPRERIAVRSSPAASSANAGHDDADAGQRREPALDVLRVVEPAADVSAGGEPHRHVGHELAVRAPVLVRHLDHLLGRGPEVVGELGALDDDADVVGEPARSRRPCP